MEDQRRSLARTYLIVAVVALDVLALVAGLIYRRVAVSRLMLDLEGQVFAVAQRLTVTVWPDVRGFADQAGALDPATLRASPEVALLDRSLASLTAGLHVVDIEVYAKDGTVLYATQADRIGTTATDAVVLDLLAGRYYGQGRSGAHTVLSHAPAVAAADGVRRTLDVVTTQVAMFSDRRAVEGVLGVGQDATSEIRRITTIEVVGIGGVIVTSTVFLAVALYAMRPSRQQKEG